MKYYISCGQSHSHIVDHDIVFDKNNLIEVESQSEQDVEDWARVALENKYSMVYSEENIDFSYWPNGICWSIKIS